MEVPAMRSICKPRERAERASSNLEHRVRYLYRNGKERRGIRNKKNTPKSASGSRETVNCPQ